jgi:hypothetical protein
METKTPSSPKVRAAIGVKSPWLFFFAMKAMDPDSDCVRAAALLELHSGPGLMRKE